MHVFRLGAIALCALAFCGPVLGAKGVGVLHVTAVPNVKGPVAVGQPVEVSLFADFTGVTNGLCFAGFKFDIAARYASGEVPLMTLSGRVGSHFNQGRNNGSYDGAGTLVDMGGGQSPPAFGGDYFTNPAFLGSFTFRVTGMIRPGPDGEVLNFSIQDFYAPSGSLNVYTSPTGSQSRPKGGIITTGHDVVFAPMSFVIAKIPAPGTMIAVATLLPLAGRRRSSPALSRMSRTQLNT